MVPDDDTWCFDDVKWFVMTSMLVSQDFTWFVIMPPYVVISLSRHMAFSSVMIITVVYMLKKDN